MVLPSKKGVKREFRGKNVLLVKKREGEKKVRRSPNKKEVKSPLNYPVCPCAGKKKLKKKKKTAVRRKKTLKKKGKRKTKGI